MSLSHMSRSIDIVLLSDKIIGDRIMPFLESEVRKLTDSPTNKMIDLWHEMCKGKFNRSIEIVVENRRRHPQFRSTPHEVNTAFPTSYKARAVLSIWVESFPGLRPMIISHEIGHWVLKLQGFRGMFRRPRDFFLEGLLNSLATHPPLYRLQRQVGHDPQNDIDARCDHYRQLFSQHGRADDLTSALGLADDLMNCSFKNRQQLEWTLSKNRVNTQRLVERILNIASNYDLYDAESNVAFRRTLVNEMKLGNWVSSDDLKPIKDLILEVGRKTSQ